MAKQNSLKKNALYTFIKSLMNIIFPIISFPYASRVLLPQGIGKVNFANSIIDYFIIIAEIGITTYGVREAARIRDDKNKLSKFVKEILCINLVSAATAYILLLLSLFFIPRLYEYRPLLIICSSKVLFYSLGINWLYTAKEEYRYITYRAAAFQAISLAFLFTLVKTPDDYYKYAMIGIFSNVGSNIFNLIYSRKFVHYKDTQKLEFKKHIKPIFTFFSITCAGKINGALDAVMLGFMEGPVSVGFYTAAVKLSRMVKELITSVISSLLPRTSYYIEQNRMEDYKILVEKAFGITVLFSFPSAFGLMFLCRPLIIIFTGTEYLAAQTAMKVMSFTIIAETMNSFLNNLILTPQHKERYLLYAQIIATVFNFTLNFILIPIYGFLGAAVATLIVEFVFPVVKLFPSWRYINSWKNLSALLKSVSGTLIMMITLYFSCRNIQSDILKILASVAVGASVYAAAEIIMKNPAALLILKTLRKWRFRICKSQ